MATRNALAATPPHAVERTLARLGANLRTARVRRGLTRAQAAEKIGTGIRAVADAERGKVSTAVSVYVALLWLYGLEQEFDQLADPAGDEVGVRLAMGRERTRARGAKALSNDF
jgi:transcriptional regulator with XRE-family HTH domain